MHVFPIAYLPSIPYLSHFSKSDNAVIDLGEYFVKQTQRTRTEILTANGRLQLSIPVEKALQTKIAVKEVRISYTESWQRKHEQAFVSAYKNAPYFEHYADLFLTLLRKKEAFLYDYHRAFFEWLLQAFQMENKKIHYSENYVSDQITADFRTKDIHFTDQKPYKQVFSYKFPFAANLSSIDLLFNKGPEAPIFL